MKADMQRGTIMPMERSKREGPKEGIPKGTTDVANMHGRVRRRAMADMLLQPRNDMCADMNGNDFPR